MSRITPDDIPTPSPIFALLSVEILALLMLVLLWGGAGVVLVAGTVELDIVEVTDSVLLGVAIAADEVVLAAQ